MALAPLGFQIDTSGVAKAVADLGNMTAATGKAEAAAKALTVNVNLAVNVVNKITTATTQAAAANDNLTTSINRQAAAIAKLTAAEARNTAAHYAERSADVAAYGAELDRLRAKYNPLFAASKRYEQELNELNRALAVGAITSREHGAALTALNARYQQAASGARAMGAGTAMAQMQMRNLAFQFQDIGTMLVAGQSPFTLLAQQLPQVTMYGGRLTGVMGALRSTLGGLFSPLGLLTTGFVLAGSAAISYFRDADDSAKEAADAIEEQISLARAMADRWGDAVPSIRAYADELERVRDLEELKNIGKQMAEDLYEPLQQAAADLRIEVADFTSQLQNAVDPSVIDAMQDAFNDLQQKVADNAAEVADAEKAQEALNQAMSLGVGDAEAISDALATFITILRDVATEAGTTRDAIDDLLDRGGIPRSQFQGGRGSDPREVEFEDEGGYWRNRYLPDPERPTRQRRARRPRKTDAERAAERYADMIRQSQQFIAMQELEARALFMTEEAAAALRYEQELLNQAANDNIKLTPEMAAELADLARDMAATEAETTRLQRALEFGKDLVRGFVSDLRSGLEQGKSFFESFGQSVLGVLDKLVDKLLNDVIDALFQVGDAGRGIGGGGGLGGLLSSLFGGLFGGRSDPWAGMRVPSYDVGTSFHPGGLARVHKDELINLPRGSQVYTAAQSRAMVANASGMAANQNMRLEVEVFVRDDGTLGAIARQAGQEGGEMAVKVYDAGRLGRLAKDIPELRKRTGGKL